MQMDPACNQPRPLGAATYRLQRTGTTAGRELLNRGPAAYSPMTHSKTDGTEPAKTAASADVHPAMPRPFKVARVEKTDAPDGSPGEDWYRYVLESGRSTITGHRRGSRKDVIAYAARCAEQLNVRGLSAQSIWSPRGRKPASSTTSSTT